MQLRTIAVLGALASGFLPSAGCVDRATAGPDRASGDAGDDDVDDVEDDGRDDGGDDAEPEPICPQIELGAQAPLSVVVEQVGQPGGTAIDCGSGSIGSGDVAVGWVAPQAGRFVAYTTGSSSDPVLAVLDGGCEGPVLACNDDGNGLESVVQWTAEAGQPFTFLVDGLGSDGATTLAIEAVDVQCPDAELGSAVPFVVDAENATAFDRGGSSCGGVGGPERLYAFTAPSDGLYGFEVGGPFDPVLHLQDGVCSFQELACNDDLPGTLFAGLAHSLSAGQTVTIAVDTVDAAGGPFTLVGDRIQAEACPALIAGGEWPFAGFGATFEGIDAAGSTCGGWATPDESWQWTAPDGGSWRVSVVADFDWVISVFDGGCDGELLGCRNAFESGVSDGSVVVQLEAGQSIAIVVDGVAGSTGVYELHIDPFEGCEAAPLPAEPPVSIVGSTVGEPAQNAGSCAPTDASPEAVYLFVPPVTGQYLLGTSGSSYDTVLYVRAGDCGGPELACNDDSPSDITSELVVDLVAGQPVYVFVDGYGGDAGPYQLDVIPL